jgi:hypothetical protein
MVREEGLPEHYYLDESDPDIVVLRRDDGTFVAAFSVRGAPRGGRVRKLYGTGEAVCVSLGCELGGNPVKWYEARRGTLVRVKEGYWKAKFAGMLGTVQHCWGRSEHAAVDVLLEDRRSELFWLTDLEIADEAIAV